ALHLDDAQGGPPHLRAAAAVDHHGRVHALEDARLHEPDLAGAALFGGGADDLDAARERQRAEGSRDGGARTRARPADDVLTAGMPDVGPRIVLGHDGDGRPAALPSTVARNALGSPPTPRSTRAPCFSRNMVSQPAACSSWKQSSGVEWIWCEIASRSSARRSTASVTLVLA